MSKAEHQKDGVSEVIGASALIFRCSQALPLTSHVASGNVLSALNPTISINEIKIFTWWRDFVDLII